MSYSAYPEYKDSGVEWLGFIPKHWDISRLGKYGKFVGGSGFPHEDQGNKEGELPFYKVSDTNLKGNEVYLKRSENYISRDVARKLSATTCPAGGIMFPKVGAALLGNKRRILTQESITDNNTMVYFPYNGKSKYWYYWLSVLDFGQISNPGPVPSVNEGQLKNFVALFPTDEEQTQIATFLDRETQKIDRLIEKQQQLIKLLQEKRQAVISHAVTKGLNPDAKMKDSGVEWLGEIPEHWKVKKFSHISMVVRGGSPRPAGDPTLFNGDYSPWVTVAEITNGNEIYLNETNTFLTKKGSEQCRIFKAGTLLLSNSGATLGVPKILNIDANANDGVVGFESLSNDVDIEYAYFYLITMTDDLRERTKQGAGQPNLNTDIVKNIVMPIPPLAEQKEILVYLHDSIHRLNVLTVAGDRFVALLKERRTALISAAVTGKIDVRNIADNRASNRPKAELDQVAG